MFLQGETRCLNVKYIDEEGPQRSAKAGRGGASKQRGANRASTWEKYREGQNRCVRVRNFVEQQLETYSKYGQLTTARGLSE